MLLDYRVTDCLHEVGLAETGVAPEEEGVSLLLSGFCSNGYGRSMCKTVAVADYEVRESKLAVKSGRRNDFSLCLACGLLLGDYRSIKSLLVSLKDKLDCAGFTVICCLYGGFYGLIELLSLKKI